MPERPMPLERQHAKERGSDSKELRRELLDGLEARTMMLVRFRESLQQFPKDLSVEEASSRIDQIREELLQDEPKEVAETIAKIHSLEEELATADEAIEGFYQSSDFEGSVEEFEDIEELEQKQYSLSDKIESLITKEVQVGMLIREACAGFKEKYKEARQFETDPEQLFSKLKELAGVEITSHDVVRTEFSPFEVIIIVPKEVLQKARGKTDVLGVHYRGTVISLVQELPTSEKMEQTIRHEGIHNSLDYGAMFSGITVRSLESILQSLERSDERREYLVRKNKQRLLSFRTPQLLDGLHEELLAELETAEQQNFSLEGVLDDPLEQLKQVFRTGRPLLSPFGSRRAVFATAGNEAGQIVLMLDGYRTLIDDEEIKNHLEKLKTEFPRAFVVMVEQIRNAFSLAERMGEEENQFMHLATLSLRPSQYRHMETLLRHRYGEEDVEAVKESRDKTELLMSRPELGVFEHVKRTFVSNLEWLADQDRERLKDYFADGSFTMDCFNKDLDLQSIKDLHDYKQLLIWFQEQLDIPPIPTGNVDDIFFDRFVEHKMETDGEWQNEEVESLTEKEKQALWASVYGVLFEAGNIANFAEEGKVLTIEDVQRNPIMNMVGLLGREGEFLRHAKKYIRDQENQDEE